MILHYEIKQHGSLFFYRRIEVFATKRLIDLPYAAFERIVFLVGKPLAFAKLLLQGIDGIHSILISSVEHFILGCLLNAQCLIVITVERIESIDIIGNDIEQPSIFAFRYFVL